MLMQLDELEEKLELARKSLATSSDFKRQND
jgi:hypothetical protein